MNRTPSRAVLVATFWCVLAAWQSVQSFARCEASSGWAAIFWGLQGLMLAAPLVAVIRLEAARRLGTTGPDVTLAIVLLAYVPMMVAMRLVEICATAR